MKILAFALLSFLLTACSDHYIYEFWSCDQSKNEINVLKLPKAYKPAKDEDVRVIGKERNPYKGPPVNARPSMLEEKQFFSTYFYPTYPDFAPLSTATLEQKKAMDNYNIATTIATAELFRSGGVSYTLRAKNDEDISVEKRTSPGHRIREESVDGKYWLWGDAWLRKGKGASDGTVIFAPKGDNTDMFFICRDNNNNQLPESPARCAVYTAVSADPTWSCLMVMYRAPIADIDRWPTVNAAIKVKFSSMMSTRESSSLPTFFQQLRHFDF
jgi:hypothetical protein